MRNVRDIEPPANAFTHRFAVGESDIDVLGHAGNVKWVQWVNDAAEAHSAAIGLDLGAYGDMGVVWVVRRHDVEYLAEATLGDSVEAVTWVDSAKGATSLRRTIFRRAPDRTLLVRAATTWALVSLARRRPTRIPPDLLARYGYE